MPTPVSKTTTPRTTLVGIQIEAISGFPSPGYWPHPELPRDRAPSGHTHC